MLSHEKNTVRYRVIIDNTTVNPYATMSPKRQLTEHVPTGLPSCGGDVAIHVFDINQPSLPIPFHSVLVSISVFIALSTVFLSINSPDNPPLSHSVLPALLVLSTIYLLRKSLLQP